MVNDESVWPLIILHSGTLQVIVPIYIVRMVN